jgi:hypothetical protein
MFVGRVRIVAIDWLASCFEVWKSRVQVLTRRLAIPTEVWRGFPHSLQANSGGSFLFASITRERRRRMLENRALRRIFGRKKDEVR